MPQTRRSMMTAVFAAFASLALTLGTAFAAELLGTVKSVDADNKKFVVTQEDPEKDVDVTVKDDTEWVNPKGKTAKKFDISKLKKGTKVKVTHEDGVASKVNIEKYAGKNKAAE
ncbi:hypothetical protein TA3x_003407 [Tundrisphaera sp. TA3]|uniref:hypothetical protein n=1 Tax=Tundrisphaera sp. TA3 TaxID=3435775 RepID=UPI003EBF003E